MTTSTMSTANGEPLGHAIGSVVAVKGSRATVHLGCDAFAAGERITVGSFLAVDMSSAALIGMVTAVDRPDPSEASARATIDLVGEIQTNADATASFRRGVSRYPTIGDAASLLPPEMIRLVFGLPKGRSISIGRLYHDQNIEALIDVDALVARHFAILGSTGVGKSSGVAVLLNEILSVRRDMRIFMLDGHNEYGRCFGELANVLDPRALKLPFWLFSFEEIVDVIFGGRPSVEEEAGNPR